ncbi:GumC family protein [Ciceribacter sp. L1K22]|uniref:GumC family protein n=1 Tax=Ciceribacter sp. L1K22 TaxID=2820275 RepID=UPI001ABE00A1|nr:GumC family protein [Ciceribacter sp. L1K22]MBO3758134.1 GumC family protein [Ciceribacter sp. L1K22]
MDIDIVQLPGILRRRWSYIAILAGVGFLFALLYALQITPLYSSSTQLIIDTRDLTVDNTNGASAATSSQQELSNLDTQLYVVVSRAVLDRVVNDLDLTADDFLLPPASRQKLSAEEALAAASGALKQHLTAERAGQSQVIVVTAQHPVAEKAARIANSVADNYLKQIEETRADAARRASSAFQVQADELRDRVLKAEAAVERFKAENDLASTGEGRLVIDQQLAGLNEQLITARGLEEQQLTIYEQAKRLTMEGIKSGGIPEALQSQTIEVLRDRYVQLLDRQTQLEANLGANHPQLRAIRSQVANMQRAIELELARLRQSMESSYQRAAANTQALQRRLENLTKSSFDSGNSQIRLRQLESEAETVQALYKSFLNRAESLGQQQSLKTNNSRVITVATPGAGTSRLVLLIIVVAGLTFGIILGSVVAVAHEIVVRTFADSEDGAEEEDIPILAQLPDHRPPSQNGLWSRMVSSRRQTEADRAAEWNKKITVLARQLADEVGEEPSPTLVFVSKDKPRGAAADVVPDLVQALVDLGYDVRYAAGSWERAETRHRAGRPSLVNAIGRDQINMGRDPDQLKYQYFSSGTQGRRVAGRPSVSRYIGAPSEGPFFTIVNACGTDAMAGLDALLPIASAAIVVQEDHTDITSVLDRLDGWHDIIMGRIVVENGD